MQTATKAQWAAHNNAKRMRQARLAQQARYAVAGQALGTTAWRTLYSRHCPHPCPYGVA